jgi:hypothetical protein
MSNFVVIIENIAAARDGIEDLNQRDGLFLIRQQRSFDANPPLRIAPFMLQGRRLSCDRPIGECLRLFQKPWGYCERRAWAHVGCCRQLLGTGFSGKMKLARQRSAFRMPAGKDPSRPWLSRVRPSRRGRSSRSARRALFVVMVERRKPACLARPARRA